SKFIGPEYGGANAQVNASAAGRVFRFSPSARIAMLQPMAPLPKEVVTQQVRAALAEDVGSGDVTTLATVPAGAVSNAAMVAREELIVCGLPFAETAFREASADVEVRLLVSEGARMRAGERILEVKGPARGLLTAERVALNFVQRLSGVATLAARFVAAVAGTKAQILDTRKTTPGWRELEKYAARCGGANNHRFGLWDMVLIKDNHL